MLDFNSWLWQKAEQDSDDIVCKFGRTFLSGELGLEWPVPVKSLDDMLTYVGGLNLSDEAKGGYLFAARVAWNDYTTTAK